MIISSLDHNRDYWSAPEHLRNLSEKINITHWSMIPQFFLSSYELLLSQWFLINNTDVGNIIAHHDLDQWPSIQGHSLSLQAAWYWRKPPYIVMMVSTHSIMHTKCAIRMQHTCTRSTGHRERSRDTGCKAKFCLKAPAQWLTGARSWCQMTGSLVLSNAPRFCSIKLRMVPVM
jgi:hypothetical protein